MIVVPDSSVFRRALATGRNPVRTRAKATRSVKPVAARMPTTPVFLSALRPENVKRRVWSRLRRIAVTEIRTHRAFVVEGSVSTPRTRTTLVVGHVAARTRTVWRPDVVSHSVGAPMAFVSTACFAGVRKRGMNAGRMIQRHVVKALTVSVEKQRAFPANRYA